MTGWRDESRRAVPILRRQAPRRTTNLAGSRRPVGVRRAVRRISPSFKGRRVETLNDADGWLVNTWRSIQLSPDAVAAAAWGPVAEIDYHARLAWLQERRTPDLVAWLEGDPEAHDAKAAGWWLYVLACGIGDPFGPGPWRVVDGHLRKVGNAGRGVNRELPHLGDAGQGQLRAYMQALAERLHRVRITCGSWERVVKPSVTRSGTGGGGSRAIFLDPPYATSGDLYAHAGGDVAIAVREWCMAAPRELRVILCGYDDEHDALLGHGWNVTEGKAGRGAGYSVNPTNGRRERLWLSPACIGTQQPSLLTLTTP